MIILWCFNNPGSTYKCLVNSGYYYPYTPVCVLLTHQQISSEHLLHARHCQSPLIQSSLKSPSMTYSNRVCPPKINIKIKNQYFQDATVG